MLAPSAGRAPTCGGSEVKLGEMVACCTLPCVSQGQFCAVWPEPMAGGLSANHTLVGESSVHVPLPPAGLRAIWSLENSVLCCPSLRPRGQAWKRARDVGAAGCEGHTARGSPGHAIALLQPERLLESQDGSSAAGQVQSALWPLSLLPWAATVPPPLLAWHVFSLRGWLHPFLNCGSPLGTENHSLIGRTVETASRSLLVLLRAAFCCHPLTKIPTTQTKIC